jgi:hypothetical protein
VVFTVLGVLNFILEKRLEKRLENHRIDDTRLPILVETSYQILFLAFLAYNIFSLVFVSFVYLIAMKHFQNYEYHKHKKGTITLATAITVSMFASFTVLYRVYVN